MRSVVQPFAMAGAYVFAGELATHKSDLIAGIAAYESEFRDYVLCY